MSEPSYEKSIGHKDEQMVRDIIENTDGVVLCDYVSDDGVAVMVDEEDKDAIWVRCWYRVRVNLLEERILKVLEAHDGCGMDNEEERRRVAKALAKELR